MTTAYAHLRIYAKTLTKLRHIFAATGESIISIVERLADQEVQRLGIVIKE